MKRKSLFNRQKRMAIVIVMSLFLKTFADTNLRVSTNKNLKKIDQPLKTTKLKKYSIRQTKNDVDAYLNLKRTSVVKKHEAAMTTATTVLVTIAVIAIIIERLPDIIEFAAKIYQIGVDSFTKTKYTGRNDAFILIDGGNSFNTNSKRDMQKAAADLSQYKVCLITFTTDGDGMDCGDRIFVGKDVRNENYQLVYHIENFISNTLTRYTLTRLVIFNYIKMKADSFKSLHGIKKVISLGTGPFYTDRDNCMHLPGQGLDISRKFVSNQGQVYFQTYDLSMLYGCGFRLRINFQKNAHDLHDFDHSYSVLENVALK